MNIKNTGMGVVVAAVVATLALVSTGERTSSPRPTRHAGRRST